MSFVDRCHFEYASASRATSASVKLTSKQRLRSRHLNLQLDVNALREQIQQLSLRRSLLESRLLAHSPSIARTATYFRVFRRGFRADEATTQGGVVEAICDDSLSLGDTGLGKSMLLEQWRRYAQHFAFRVVTPPRLQVVANDGDGAVIVRADTSFHGAFTQHALEIVFPAVARDPSLVQQLLGREMVTPMRFHLHFNRRGRMIRHDFEADFVTALARALGDVTRAAAIVGEAAIAEEGMVAAVESIGHREPEPERCARDENAKHSRIVMLDDDCDSEETSAIENNGSDARLSVDFLLS